MVVKFALESDWPSVVETFERMFEGLGVVSADAASVGFTSLAPHVATDLVLNRSGKMAASMPLHAIENTFTDVVFEDDLTALSLIGSHGSYTYRVPSELLNLRSS